MPVVNRRRNDDDDDRHIVMDTGLPSNRYWGLVIREKQTNSATTKIGLDADSRIVAKLSNHWVTLTGGKMVLKDYEDVVSLIDAFSIIL